MEKKEFMAPGIEVIVFETEEIMTMPISDNIIELPDHEWD